MKVSELSPEQQEMLRRLRAEKAKLQAAAGAAQAPAQPQADKLEADASDKRKKKNKGRAKRTEATVNPYLNTRVNYRSVFEKLNSALMWRTILMLSGYLIAGAFAACYIAEANKAKVIPYVIYADQFGTPLAGGAVAAAPAANEMVTRSFAAQFITNARAVTLDTNVLKRNVYAVYAHLRTGDPAMNKFREYYEGRNGPIQRAAEELVDVKINSVLAMSPNTYQVDWVETTRNRAGEKLKPDTPMRGLVTWVKADPAPDVKLTTEDVIGNPFFLYVTDFSWSELQ